MRGEGSYMGRKATAIPGGGTGPRSAWKFRSAEGYKTQAEINRAKSEAKGESASLKGGLTWGTSMHPYDGHGGTSMSGPARSFNPPGETPKDYPTETLATGTSIFDPVLCELAYRWFCPPGGLVLDPFAGGSVRGIVAAKLGRRYIGIDLRKEQVQANRDQAREILKGAKPTPEWRTGDACDIAKLLPKTKADFIFTCPPYGDLERYSDDERDLSTMDYGRFIDALCGIVQATATMLKPERFAGIVVGDFRDKRGFYRGFVSDTISAFSGAGLKLYNEAILVTAAGSLPIRAGKQFAATRKLGKTHQNFLVFAKGDPVKATKAVGDVEFLDVDELGTPTEFGERITASDLGGEV
jgi:hypothetical protein